VTDLWELDATAQAALVRDGNASPLELVDAAIARIEKFNPELEAAYPWSESRPALGA
jgi:amidase